MSNGTAGPQITPETPTTEPELTLPPENADYIDLGVYIKRHLQASERLENESIGFGRLTTVHRWYAGAALKIVHDRETRARKWVEWCNAHGFNVNTCYEAIRLFVRSGSVENVQNLTITEARKKYQTSKRSFRPEGSQPQPKKVAPKAAPKIKYKETPTLKRFRDEAQNLAEVVTGADDDDWKNADPDIFLGYIDSLMEKLKQAKNAIRRTQKEATAALKAKSKVTATGTVEGGSRKS